MGRVVGEQGEQPKSRGHNSYLVSCNLNLVWILWKSEGIELSLLASESEVSYTKFVTKSRTLYRGTIIITIYITFEINSLSLCQF